MPVLRRLPDLGPHPKITFIELDWSQKFQREPLIPSVAIQTFSYLHIDIHTSMHLEIIEIRLEQAPFFSSFEHVKSLLIMGPNYTKKSSLKCDFLIINDE